MKIKVIPYDRPGAELPIREHYNDAGADVVVPDGAGCILPAHETVTIPLGFGLEIPDGYMATIYPRSSLASSGLVCEMPPIDAGYRGELKVILINHGDEDFLITAGMRIAQLVISSVVSAEFIAVASLEDSARGEGGFGSSGTNSAISPMSQFSFAQMLLRTSVIIFSPRSSL